MHIYHMIIADVHTACVLTSIYLDLSVHFKLIGVLNKFLVNNPVSGRILIKHWLLFR